MNDEQALRDFLARADYMTIAVTLDDGSPWAVPVKIQLQWGNAFEWDSKTDTEHSQVINKRPNIMLSAWEKIGDTQFGFYAEATAALETENERGTGRYRAVIKRAWINDQSFIKREVELE